LDSVSILLLGLDCVGKRRLLDLIKDKSGNTIDLIGFSDHMESFRSRIPETLRPNQLRDAQPHVRKTLQMFACADLLVPTSQTRIISGQLIIDDNGMFNSGLVESAVMLKILDIDLIVMLHAEPEQILSRRQKFVKDTKNRHNIPKNPILELERIRTHQEAEKRNASNIALNNHIRFLEISHNDSSDPEVSAATADKIIRLIELIKSETRMYEVSIKDDAKTPAA